MTLHTHLCRLSGNIRVGHNWLHTSDCEIQIENEMRLHTHLCRLGGHIRVGAIMGEPGDPPPDGLLEPHPLPPCAGSLHLLKGLPTLFQHLKRKVAIHLRATMVKPPLQWGHFTKPCKLVHILGFVSLRYNLARKQTSHVPDACWLHVHFNFYYC